jgi:hypothetical protein
MILSRISHQRLVEAGSYARLMTLLLSFKFSLQHALCAEGKINLMKRRSNGGRKSPPLQSKVSVRTAVTP